MTVSTKSSDAENMDGDAKPQQRQNQQHQNHHRQQHLMSFHQANIWFNECYADYLARRPDIPRPSVKVMQQPVMSCMSDDSTAAMTTNTIGVVDQKEIMRMLCCLMKENAILRQENELKKNVAELEGRVLDSNQNCTVVKADEVHSKSSLTFESKLIIRGKVLGSVHCKRAVQAVSVTTEGEKEGYSVNADGFVDEPTSSPSASNGGNGQIKSYRGCVIVEEGGVLNSNLHRIHEVIVRGRVIGKIDCEVLHVGPVAQIVGNIRVQSLSVENGATIVGKITTGRAFPHRQPSDQSSSCTETVKNENQMNGRQQMISEFHDEKMKKYIQSINKIMEKAELTSDDFYEIQKLYNNEIR